MDSVVVVTDNDPIVVPCDFFHVVLQLGPGNQGEGGFVGLLVYHTPARKILFHFGFHLFDLLEFDGRIDESRVSNTWKSRVECGIDPTSPTFGPLLSTIYPLLLNPALRPVRSVGTWRAKGRMVRRRE